MPIRLKRIYENPERSDGLRILVDRLWPRGLTREEAAIDEWMKDIAPSNRLRSWFGHRPERWKEFRKRYTKELNLPDHKNSIDNLARISRIATVTLLYGAKDDDRNNAVALAEFLKRKDRTRHRHS